MLLSGASTYPIPETVPDVPEGVSRCLNGPRPHELNSASAGICARLID
jgi:hypothetical protein